MSELTESLTSEQRSALKNQIKQLFHDRSDCYADSEDDIPAMTEEVFSDIMIEHISDDSIKKILGL